jgi:hypothetical protein
MWDAGLRVNACVLRCARFALILLACVLVPALAWANAARLARDGTIASEPEGLLNVAIVRETLTIDLREIPSNGTTLVEAAYRLDNRGEQRRLELAFVAGSPVERFDARLDGAWVATRLVPVDPETWPPPPTVPEIGGGTRVHSMRHPEMSQAFTIELPPGEHELVVRYQGMAANDRTCAPTICWTFAYLLAPARTWAEFGGLDATILVPPAWEIAVEPAFEREGDVLRASFSELPADVIGATLQAPGPAGYGAVVVATWLLYALVVIGGGWVTLRAGAWWHSLRGRIVPFFVVPAWTAAVVLAGTATIALPRAMVSGRQAPSGGYDDLWPWLALFVCLPLGIVLAIIGARRQRNREAI